MRSTIVGMTSLTEQLPYVYAFPDALGTGLLVHTESVLDDEIRDRIGSFIHEYEVVLSRFRDDSIVGRMRTAAHGGTFDFPDWASGLFGLYDRLFAATDGAIDPCVGEDLIRLGYDESYSFTGLAMTSRIRLRLRQMPLNMQARSTDEPFGQPTLSGMAQHW
ncbi:putative uncharacterized protein [Bifidobacterium longum CAG:69]|nr:putative uncharacterized protein [Bifidobacterium longum CAG:69]